jgi:glutamate-1-semialdehyde 2,1-aminomutase
VDGDTYTDFLGEYTAGVFGHDNKDIKEAIEEALANGWNLGGSNLYEKELAKKVRCYFPYVSFIFST